MITVNIKPLTVNQAWQGKRFKTPLYKAWRKDMYLLLPKIKEVQGKLKVSIIFGFSNKLSDIDNPLKPLLDSFKDKYKIDDRNIYILEVSKEIVPKGSEFIKFEIVGL